MSSKKKKNSPKNAKREAEWAEAKSLCRLSADHVRMAKELGMNPRSLVKNIPSPTQQWKAPVRVWIVDLYEKRFGRTRPMSPRGTSQPCGPSRERTDDGGLGEPPEMPSPVHDPGAIVEATDPACIPFPGVIDDLDEEDGAFLKEDGPEEDDDDWDWEGDLDFSWTHFGPPSRKQIAEENSMMMRRWKEFRIAAVHVAAFFGKIPAVRRVVLFGSAAVPLEKEVPRFREFRRHGIAIWHECADVDLAVWVDDLNDLKTLQRARRLALEYLMKELGIGVAHHQADIFLFEPGTDRYWGRLCDFNKCPKERRECAASGCGASRFLRQIEGFRFRAAALDPQRSKVIFDRDLAPGILNASEIVEGA